MSKPQLFRAVLFLCLCWVSTGCSRPPGSLEGRWLDQKEDTFLEFTASGLCAEVSTGPMQVLLNRYEVQGDTLVLTSLACGWNFKKPRENVWPGTVQRLSFSMNETEMRLQGGKVTRRFKRAALPNDRFRLQGLWSAVRPDHRVDYFEITPWGDMISLVWFPQLPAEEKTRNNLATPLRLAEWHNCSLVGETLRVNGFSLVQPRRRFSAKVDRGDAKLRLTRRSNQFVILSKVEKFE